MPLSDELRSFTFKRYWCQSEKKVVLCSGPCPSGEDHELLDPCPQCEGLGKVNATTVQHVDNHGRVMRRLLGDLCSSCNGNGSLPKE